MTELNLRGPDDEATDGVALVVLERGAEWPAPIEDCGELVALSDNDDALLAHTVRCLKVLEREHRSVRVVVLACNTEVTREALERRLGVGRVLREAIERSPRGLFVLAGDSASDRAARDHLYSLMAVFADELRGTPNLVMLRFNDAPPQSRRGVAAR